jgi:hypothetical protein
VSSKFASAAVAGALTTTMLAACGGGSKLAKAEWITKGDAICAKSDKKRSAIPSPSFAPGKATKADLPAAADYFDKALPTFTDELKQLHALGHSKQDDALLQRVLAGAGQLGNAVDALRQAARRGDVAGFKTGLIRAATTSAQANTLAKQFGFKVCGGAA